MRAFTIWDDSSCYIHLSSTWKPMKATLVFQSKHVHSCECALAIVPSMFHRENGGTLGTVPSIVNPIYTLYSGYLLGIPLLRGFLGVKQQGTIPRVPSFSLIMNIPPNCTTNNLHTWNMKTGFGQVGRVHLHFLESQDMDFPPSNPWDSYICLHLVDIYSTCKQICHTWILWVIFCVVGQMFFLASLVTK